MYSKDCRVVLLNQGQSSILILWKLSTWFETIVNLILQSIKWWGLIEMNRRDLEWNLYNKFLRGFNRRDISTWVRNNFWSIFRREDDLLTYFKFKKACFYKRVLVGPRLDSHRMPEKWNNNLVKMLKNIMKI